MRLAPTLALALAMTLLPLIASAQNPYDAGIFGDPAGTTCMITIDEPYVPTKIYAVAFDLGGGVEAFELGVQFHFDG